MSPNTPCVQGSGVQQSATGLATQRPTVGHRAGHAVLVPLGHANQRFGSALHLWRGAYTYSNADTVANPDPDPDTNIYTYTYTNSYSYGYAVSDCYGRPNGNCYSHTHGDSRPNANS